MSITIGFRTNIDVSVACRFIQATYIQTSRRVGTNKSVLINFDNSLLNISAYFTIKILASNSWLTQKKHSLLLN